MLFLLDHAVIELKIHRTVFLTALSEPLLRGLDAVLKNLLNVFDVVEQHLLCFFLTATGCVGVTDLPKVVPLVSEELLGHLVRVLKRTVLSVVL